MANTEEAEKKIGGTSPVGMYPNGASDYGIQDMIGNVWEWCLDWYNENEYKRSSPVDKERLGKEVQDPDEAKSGNARVLRGGSWGGSRNLARCSFRRRYVPVDFNNRIGFRLVCSPSFKTLQSESLNSESLIRKNEK